MPLNDDDNEFIDALVGKLKEAWQTPQTQAPENHVADGHETATKPTVPQAETHQELTTPASESAETTAPVVQVETPEVTQTLRKGLRARFSRNQPA